MIRRDARGRAGITLTEILISIMIMGVGLVSLATLFPLGLLRLRAAAVKSRSAFLVGSAEADIATRNLLSRESFLSSGWYFAGRNYDPWVQDTPAFNQTWRNGAYRGNGGIGVPTNVPQETQFDPITLKPIPIPGPGLPVAYDPLWRATTGIYPDSNVTEARFGVGVNIRNDPNGIPAARHGLQRITNFPNLANINTLVVPNIFVSPDDIVFQSTTDTTGTQGIGSASPLVPDMSAGMVNNDWMYTWMFTGRRSDAREGTSYEGDIVIFHGRPLAVTGTGTAADPVVAAGEPVVEAVFGYSRNIVTAGGADGYGTADRVVLLRWPATVPDPDIRVGGWIADVTYERVKQREFNRQTALETESLISYPNQRCHWYQVVKKSPPEVAVNFGEGAGRYRSMTVVVGSNLQAKTPMTRSTGRPLHVNVALVSPYVVSVFPKSFIMR